MTLRVREAVIEFLMPLSWVDALDLAFFLSSSDVVGFVFSSSALVASPLASLFFLFLLPGAFFSACVRPFSRSVLTRRLSRAMSVGIVGKIGITSFSA